MNKIRLYAMNVKGLSALEALENNFGPDIFESVVSEKDEGVAKDFFAEIKNFCAQKNIPFFKRGDAGANSSIAKIAVGWRWLIESDDLYILHDSLLPRYRGFAPLVSALINGEKELGVSALKASDEYDQGPLLLQKSVAVQYPLKISTAIATLLPLYQSLAVELAKSLTTGRALAERIQDESKATYSLWRDADDYKIDWNQDATKIRRFIDALGSPYPGALTQAGQESFRIWEAEELPDVKIENRTPGKVIFLKDRCPVIVCQKGLLKILRMSIESGQDVSFPLKSFRLKFA